MSSSPLDGCQHCGGILVFSRHKSYMPQQLEFMATPTMGTQHPGFASWRPHSRKVHYAPSPNEAVRPAPDSPASLPGGRQPRLVLHHP